MKNVYIFNHLSDAFLFINSHIMYLCLLWARYCSDAREYIKTTYAKIAYLWSLQDFLITNYIPNSASCTDLLYTQLKLGCPIPGSDIPPGKGLLFL